MYKRQVLQSYGLVTTLTASENVAIALRGRGVAAVEATEKASEALARVSVDELADRLISELSGGQLQRVWLACCLAQDTGVLLLTSRRRSSTCATRSNCSTSSATSPTAATSPSGSCCTTSTTPPRSPTSCT